MFNVRRLPRVSASVLTNSLYDSREPRRRQIRRNGASEYPAMGARLTPEHNMGFRFASTAGQSTGDASRA